MIELPQIDLSRFDPKHSPIQSIAVLTSGGDAPGMNAAIRAVVRSACFYGIKTYGIQRGYSGLTDSNLSDNSIVEMDVSSVANIIQRGGTILKTSRCPEFQQVSGRRKAAHILKSKGIHALVVIGGDGSFRGAHRLSAESGISVVGIPGTIDNDIWGTDLTIGFDTAVNTGLDAIDRIRDTASSHDRVFIVEVMGRESGFIALQVGIGGGAESIVVPEFPTPNKEICRVIERGIDRGKTSSIIVVAEGKKEGNAHILAQSLMSKGYSPKICILGHVQRGGTPTANDRLLASALGQSAVMRLLQGHSQFMVGIEHNRVVFPSLDKVVSQKKRLNRSVMDLALTLAI